MFSNTKPVHKIEKHGQYFKHFGSSNFLYIGVTIKQQHWHYFHFQMAENMCEVRLKFIYFVLAERVKMAGRKPCDSEEAYYMFFRGSFFLRKGSRVN